MQISISISITALVDSKVARLLLGLKQVWQRAAQRLNRRYQQGNLRVAAGSAAVAVALSPAALVSPMALVLDCASHVRVARQISTVAQFRRTHPHRHLEGKLELHLHLHPVKAALRSRRRLARLVPVAARAMPARLAVQAVQMQAQHTHRQCLPVHRLRRLLLTLLLLPLLRGRRAGRRRLQRKLPRLSVCSASESAACLVVSVVLLLQVLVPLLLLERLERRLRLRLWLFLQRFQLPLQPWPLRLRLRLARPHKRLLWLLLLLLLRLHPLLLTPLRRMQWQQLWAAQSLLRLPLLLQLP